MNQKNRMILYLLLAILSVIAVVWFVRDNKGNTWTTSPSNPPSGPSFPSESLLTQEIMNYLRKLGVPNMPTKSQIAATAKYLRQKYCPATTSGNSPSSPSSPSYPTEDELKQDIMNYLKSKGVTTITPSQVSSLTKYLSTKYCPACAQCEKCDTSSSPSGCGPVPETFSVRTTISPNNLYDAGAICASFGANVATKAQVQEAYNKGASWCIRGAVADDSANAYFPLNDNTNCNYYPEAFYTIPFNSQGENAVNCYGIKPSAQYVDVFANISSPMGSVAYFNDAASVWSVNDL
jgi:hypothetical protein